MTKIILYFFLNIFLIHNYGFSKELFGYKLHSDIYQYTNDGKINYNKEDIDSIEIFKDKVKIPNTYLTQYVIKSTTAGNIYEIHEKNIKDLPGEVYLEITKEIYINIIDKSWVEHIQSMDYLRQGIGLRSYAQKNPKQ